MNTYLVSVEFKNGYRCEGEFAAHNESEAIAKASDFVADDAKSVLWWYIDRENPIITAKLI